MPANPATLPQTEEQIDITGGSFQVFGVTGVPHLPVNKPPTISLVTTTLLTQVRKTVPAHPAVRGLQQRNGTLACCAQPSARC